MIKHVLLVLCLSAPAVHAQVGGRVTVGTSAKKPAACSADDLYVASDTNLIYQCRAANTWNEIRNLNTAILLKCKNLDNIRCVDAANSAGWNGTTADAWINAAIANLPAGGGTVDARGLGAGAQIIAATVNVGGPSTSVTLLLDPANFHGWVHNDGHVLDGPNGVIDGLTVNNTSLGTYAGNVVKFGAYGNCGDHVQCRLTNFNIANGTPIKWNTFRKRSLIGSDQWFYGTCVRGRDHREDNRLSERDLSRFDGYAGKRVLR